MQKTLAIILHYNSVQYTDTLYQLLKPYERDEYDLIVIDNGSDPGKVSKYANFSIEQNCYYGGGLDVCFNYFIENKQYDSLVVLNSDLIIQGKNFIREMRNQLFSNNLHMLSACVIQPSFGQCYWPHMHCHNAKELRYVKWVDYQCVLLKREFVETVKSFNSKYGWVQDIMSGLICYGNNWEIAVCDWLPVIHIGNGSIKDNYDKPDIRDYNMNAEIEMYRYFHARGLMSSLNEYREWAQNYEYNPRHT